MWAAEQVAVAAGQQASRAAQAGAGAGAGAGRRPER